MLGSRVLSSKNKRGGVLKDCIKLQIDTDAIDAYFNNEINAYNVTFMIGDMLTNGRMDIDFGNGDKRTNIFEGYKYNQPYLVTLTKTKPNEIFTITVTGDISSIYCGTGPHTFITSTSMLTDICSLSMRSLESLAYMFEGNMYLAKLPKNLWNNNLSNVISCRYMFLNCSGLTSLPSDFFKGMPNRVMNCSGMFSSCSGLTSLPSDFFKDMPNSVMNCSRMFSSCSGLTSLPSDLFNSMPNSVTSCGSMFEGCTGLTSLPSDFFNSMPNSVTSCGSMFEGCTNLEAPSIVYLPASVTYYTYMFSDVKKRPDALVIGDTTITEGFY